MKNSINLTVTTLLLAAPSLSAATLYVSLQSTNPPPPYATWATAATNIQQAVDAAGPRAEIVVTNGVYAGRLAVTNPLALRSVNGPQFTVINGGRTNWCLFLTDGPSLTGSTVTNGAEHEPGLAVRAPVHEYPQAGTTIHTDTNAESLAPLFCRVGAP